MGVLSTFYGEEGLPAYPNPGEGALRPQGGPNPSLSYQTQLAWRNSRRGSWSPNGPWQAKQPHPGEARGSVRWLSFRVLVSRLGVEGGSFHTCCFLN